MWAKRSQVKRRLKDWRGALEDLERAVRLNCDYEWTWEGKKNEDEDRDYSRALAEITEATEAFPELGAAWAWKGSAATAAWAFGRRKARSRRWACG